MNIYKFSHVIVQGFKWNVIIKNKYIKLLNKYTMF